MMTDDPARKACLDAAYEMASTGTFKDYMEVEEALSVSESGIWHECLTEPEIRQHINQLCTAARDNHAAKASSTHH